jgi:sugar O-acyltransferase (sialic acid O-acetyltransferase NeuD family)
MNNQHPNPKPQLLLIGGGGHCKSVIDVIEQQNIYTILGIIDTKENIGKKVLGYDVIGCDDDLEQFASTCNYALITVGHIKSNALRVRLFNLAKEIGFSLPSIVSPLAYVSKHAKLEEGTIVMHHALVNAGAKIGQNCIINSKALIEHDTTIEEHCHISTGAILNGGVHVKANTFYGSNATCKECVTIDGFIKAGSVVK